MAVVYNYDFDGVKPLEGSADGAGLTHIDPGPYVVSLALYEETTSKSGNPMVHITNSIVDGPEAGTTLDDYFVLTEDQNGRKKMGWRRLHQFFTAVGVNLSSPNIEITSDDIEAHLVGKKHYVMVVKDEKTAPQEKVDGEGNIMYEDDGVTPQYWPESLRSRVDYYQSLKKAERPAVVQQAETVAAAAEPAKVAAPPAKAASAKAAAAPDTAAVKTPAVAAAATADERDSLFND